MCTKKFALTLLLFITLTGTYVYGKRKLVQVGLASWYGKSFHGRSSASGQPFNMFLLTAAHRTLPFGTLVKVTNCRTHDEVIVTITDRGPNIPGRIIDLSYAAGLLLHMRDVEKVKIEEINGTSKENSN